MYLDEGQWHLELPGEHGHTLAYASVALNFFRRLSELFDKALLKGHS